MSEQLKRHPEQPRKSPPPIPESAMRELSPRKAKVELEMEEIPDLQRYTVEAREMFHNFSPKTWDEAYTQISNLWHRSLEMSRILKKHGVDSSVLVDQINAYFDGLPERLDAKILKGLEYIYIDAEMFVDSLREVEGKDVVDGISYTERLLTEKEMQAEWRLVRSLNLSETQLKPADVRVIVKLPYLNGLRKLDLTLNLIGPKGVKAILNSDLHDDIKKARNW